MSDAALFEGDAFESDEFEELDEADGLEEFDLDSADGFDDDEFSDEFEAVDGLDELDGFEDDAFDDFEDDGLDELDEMGDFAVDPASGLYMPGATSLMSGPAATAIMARLNPAVLDSLDADEADAFFGRIGGFLKRAVGGIGRGIGGALRKVTPFISRILPMVQKVAGFAGPWGKLVSAGLGGIQGLMQGKGLRGALSGALGGLIPGGAGKLLSGVMGGGGGGLGGVLSGLLGGGDGADDDAAVDALADMVDARHVHGRVALPIGAGLVARAIARLGLRPALRRMASGVLHRVHGVVPRLRHVERTLLHTANRIGGSAGRRLRVLRTIGRQAASAVRHHLASGPAAAIRSIPGATRTVARRVAAAAVRQPRFGAISPALATRRVVARRRIMRRIPLDLLFRGYARMSAA